jgi:hypothetical protein
LGLEGSTRQEFLPQLTLAGTSFSLAVDGVRWVRFERLGVKSNAVLNKVQIVLAEGEQL